MEGKVCYNKQTTLKSLRLNKVTSYSYQSSAGFGEAVLLSFPTQLLPFSGSAFLYWLEFSLVPLHLLSRQGKNEKIKHHTEVIYGPGLEVFISTHIPMARTQLTQPHCCLAGWPSRKGDKIWWTHSSPCPMARTTYNWANYWERSE